MFTLRRLRLPALVLVLVSVAAGCSNGSGESCETGVEQSVTEGLTIVELECGDGPEAKTGDQVLVHYTGTLEDGTEFDSSAGGDPLPFTVGAGDVIEGFDQGVRGLKVGGKRELTIGPDLAYGDQGVPPDIPPGATLIFEIELVEITSQS